MFNIKNFVLYSFVFFFCWFFFFSLTHGINFFWEDAFFFENLNSSLLAHVEKFSSILFDTNTIYSIEYMHRPLQRIYWGTLADLFGQNILLFRIYNAIIPALFATIIFGIVSIYANNYVGIMAVAYFISSTELFIAVLYSSDTRMIMHLLTIVALLLFLAYTKEKKNFNQYLLIFSIVIMSRLSLLFKHEGRIVLPIVLLYCIFLKCNILKRRSFIILIALLILTTTPWLCFEKETCGLGLGPEGAIVHLPIENFFLNFYTVINFIGWPIVILLSLNLLLLFILQISNHKLNKNITNITCFFFIWSLFELLLVFISKGFNLDLYIGSTFQRLDFSIVMFPITLLVFSSSILVNKALKSFANCRKIFLILTFILIVISITAHAKDLNAWRGGWGEYFLGWNQILEYIDTTTSNSLLILNNPNFNIPFISFSTNKAEVRDVLDIQYIKQKSDKYSKIFAGDRNNLPKNNIFINCKSFKTKDNTIYGTLKNKLLKIKSKQKFEICEYDVKNI